MPGIGERARSTPDAAAVIEGASVLTFRDLDERQRLLAGALRSRGLKRGDRVALLSANRRELLEVSAGSLRAGFIPVPIHSALAPPEAGYVIEDSGARLLFTDRTFDSLPSLDEVVTFGDAYERLLFDAAPGDLSDFALGRPMHYTSGTTGRPKGVWVPVMDEATAARFSDRFRSLWTLVSDDIHLVCSPLSHSAPHRFSLRTLEAGGAVAIQRKFDAGQTLAAIELYGATSAFMVPTHLERIFGLERKVLLRHDLSSMRLLVHAGAPIREETKRKAIEMFPRNSVWEFYGSTEGQATRISTPEWEKKPGSVGKALPGARVSILDDGGEELPPGKVGDVWVEDPNSERFAYWRSKRKTESAWRGDAFTVGDMGSLDEDGYLYLAGRKHDMLITGGVNVYPQEVEAVLLEHPAVAEAVVYGTPHDEWGQQVSAMVVGSFGQPLEPEALIRWMRERLAGYKCPRVIDVVDELPRTPSGKVKRPSAAP